MSSAVYIKVILHIKDDFLQIFCVGCMFLLDYFSWV